jgi:hypothetical protein
MSHNINNNESSYTTTMSHNEPLCIQATISTTMSLHIYNKVPQWATTHTSSHINNNESPCLQQRAKMSHYAYKPPHQQQWVSYLQQLATMSHYVYISHHINNNESPHLQQRATIYTVQASHNIHNQWASTSQPMCHHIINLATSAHLKLS